LTGADRNSNLRRSIGLARRISCIPRVLLRDLARRLDHNDRGLSQSNVIVIDTSNMSKTHRLLRKTGSHFFARCFMEQDDEQDGSGIA
jgi:hypothetical protein